MEQGGVVGAQPVDLGAEIHGCGESHSGLGGILLTALMTYGHRDLKVDRLVGTALPALAPGQPDLAFRRLVQEHVAEGLTTVAHAVREHAETRSSPKPLGVGLDGAGGFQPEAVDQLSGPATVRGTGRLRPSRSREEGGRKQRPHQRIKDNEEDQQVQQAERHPARLQADEQQAEADDNRDQEVYVEADVHGSHHCVSRSGRMKRQVIRRQGVSAMAKAAISRGR
ncbi:hypothetical protein [Streptomyces fagopyri]|uniref:hypothetical protein n=1 Tax=Streptomyces fagopyri TaxID=2662397 RepID=UPI0037FE427D